LLGYWNGRAAAIKQTCEAIAPLIFATIYDAMGNQRGSEMLYATAIVSCFSVLAYTPLLKLMPKPKKVQEDKEDMQDLSVYENMSDLEWSQLPMSVTDQVNAKQLEAGKEPRLVPWGDYLTELSAMTGLRNNICEDFGYLRDGLTVMLSNRELMLQEQQSFQKFEAHINKSDREKAQAELGAWISQYFDDAGYPHWEKNSKIYKMLLLAAFPPINDLNGQKADYTSMPLDEWEAKLTKFLSVLDNHLASEQKRIQMFEEQSFLTSLLRHR